MKQESHHRGGLSSLEDNDPVFVTIIGADIWSRLQRTGFSEDDFPEFACIILVTWNARLLDTSEQRSASKRVSISFVELCWEDDFAAVLQKTQKLRVIEGRILRRTGLSSCSGCMLPTSSSPIAVKIVAVNEKMAAMISLLGEHIHGLTGLTSKFIPNSRRFS